MYHLMGLVFFVSHMASPGLSSETQIFEARCHSGTRVLVNATDITPSSTYSEYKSLVCVACELSECDTAMLVKTYFRRNDSDTIDVISELEDLTLSTEAHDGYVLSVAYTCPNGDAHRVPCQINATLEQCLVSQCDQCHDEKCYVYAGYENVGPCNVSISAGQYYVETWRTRHEKVAEAFRTHRRLRYHHASREEIAIRTLLPLLGLSHIHVQKLGIEKDLLAWAQYHSSLQCEQTREEPVHATDDPVQATEETPPETTRAANVFGTVISCAFAVGLVSVCTLWILHCCVLRGKKSFE